MQTVAVIARGDSMILAFYVPAMASVQGQCDIDRVLPEKFLKIGKTWHGGIKPILVTWDNSYNRSYFTAPGFPIFLNFSE